MTERTTTIDGVTVTEAQLREALKRIETPDWLPKDFPSIKTFASDGRHIYIVRRGGGEYTGRGLYVGHRGSSVQWKLVRDSRDCLVLVPEDLLLEKDR